MHFRKRGNRPEETRSIGQNRHHRNRQTGCKVLYKPRGSGIMGVTIAYRGQLADLARIEDFEDRLVDFALEIGGQAQIWRTWADDDPERMVRGVILDLAPGQESTSLLLSPEGWLIGLTDIQDAEEGRLKEPPWCFVKTQFGAVEGHVALVEMFAALKREFLPDLEVSDEGGYWETHDLAELVRRRTLIEGAIDGLAEGLRRYGLSREAAEDPDILLRHVERVAEHVHRTLRRPAEHPPIAFEDDDDFGGAAIRKRQKSNGTNSPSTTAASRNGCSAPSKNCGAVGSTMNPRSGKRCGTSSRTPRRGNRTIRRAVARRRATRRSVNRSRTRLRGDAGFREADDDRFDTEEEERHPLLQRAMDLLVRLRYALS